MAAELADTFLRSGKVRDLYALDDDRLLLVASDRISAFDVVLPTPIPDKGRVLTGLSRFWFAETGDASSPNHLRRRRPAESTRRRPAPRRRRRAARPDHDLPRASQPLPIEVIVRGYLAGYGWKDYRPDRRGLRHPAAGGPARERPAARAALHAVDEGRGRATTRTSRLRRRRPTWSGRERRGAGRARSRSRCIAAAPRSPSRRGIILADTKFEFGDGPATAS